MPTAGEELTQFACHLPFQDGRVRAGPEEQKRDQC